jgi:hypothetical protein
MLIEMAELVEALRSLYPDNVVKECVDIANYAMMIADNNNKV